MKKLILNGPAKRFNFEGVLYLALADDGKTPVIYEVDDKQANHLLEQYERETGFSYFEEYTGPAQPVKAAVALDDDRPKRVAKKQPKINERFKGTERAPRTETTSADGIIEV